MEGFSTFQWGVCFSDEGASILSGRCTSWGPAVLMGGVSKKIIGRGGASLFKKCKKHFRWLIVAFRGDFTKWKGKELFLSYSLV